LSQRKAVEESLKNCRARYEKEISGFRQKQKLFTEAKDVVAR
jgi:hypothetical protein